MNILPLPDDRLTELFALYDQYNRPKDPPPTNTKAIQILNNIRSQGAEVFVAIRENRLLGTYMIHICQNLTRSGQPFGIIENVICDRESRRSGVGRQLMRHAVDYAEKQGCFKVALQTGTTKIENHSFYESCGFTKDKQAFQVRLKNV